jgi:hypothetical protein
MCDADSGSCPWSEGEQGANLQPVSVAYDVSLQGLSQLRSTDVQPPNANNVPCRPESVLRGGGYIMEEKTKTKQAIA